MGMGGWVCVGWGLVRERAGAGSAGLLGGVACFFVPGASAGVVGGLEGR